MLSKYGLLFALACGPLFAHDNVVIIPLYNDSDNPSAPAPSSTIYVATAGAPFDSLHNALNSIKDASASKPYTIFIAPGDYVLESTLQLKPYVHIVGSGKYATRLNARISGSADDSSSAMIAGANNASISNLAIENSTASRGLNGRNTIGIHNLSTSIQIHDIDIFVSGLQNAYGIFNNHSPSSTMRHINVLVEAQEISYGIFSSASSIVMLDINVVSLGEKAGYGLYLGTDSSDTFDGGNLDGSSRSLVIFSSTASDARIKNTQIVGGNASVFDRPLSSQCSFAYDESLSSVNC